MARITLRQLLDHAAEENYGVPAFNVSNYEQFGTAGQASKIKVIPVKEMARRYQSGELFLN